MKSNRGLHARCLETLSLLRRQFEASAIVFPTQPLSLGILALLCQQLWRAITRIRMAFGQEPFG